jgi:hypothetical protein
MMAGYPTFDDLADSSIIEVGNAFTLRDPSLVSLSSPAPLLT